MNLRDIPNSYGEAARLLNDKNRDVLTVANNTQVHRFRATDSFGLTLHGHLIVLWRSSGQVVLDSCGYRSVTTKDRLNRAQRVVGVCQRKNIWYVVRRNSDQSFDCLADPEPFVDGLTFTDEAQAAGSYYDKPRETYGD